MASVYPDVAVRPLTPGNASIDVCFRSDGRFARLVLVFSEIFTNVITETVVRSGSFLCTGDCFAVDGFASGPF